MKNKQMNEGSFTSATRTNKLNSLLFLILHSLSNQILIDALTKSFKKQNIHLIIQLLIFGMNVVSREENFLMVINLACSLFLYQHTCSTGTISRIQSNLLLTFAFAHPALAYICQTYS